MQKIEAASIQDLIALATYYGECSVRESARPIALSGLTQKGVTFENNDKVFENLANTSSNIYYRKKMEIEAIIEKYMALSISRLKDKMQVSTQGKTLEQLVPTVDVLKTPDAKQIKIPFNPDFLGKTSAIKEKKANKEETKNLSPGAGYKEEKTELEKKIEQGLAYAPDQKVSDTTKEVYTQLVDVPLTKEEQKELVESWEKSKGEPEKAAIYYKVCDLMNNYSLGIRDLRSTINNLTTKFKNANKDTKEKELLTEFKAQKLTGKIGVDLNKLISGKELAEEKVPLAVKNEFNTTLLVGTSDFNNPTKCMDSCNPDDLVKARALYFRSIKKDHVAIQELIHFYSDKKNGHVWDKEKALNFLNLISKENKGNPMLDKLIENLFLYHKEKDKDFRKAEEGIRKLIKAYSYSIKSVPAQKPKAGKTTATVETGVEWPNSKVDNIMNRVIKKMHSSGLLTEEEMGDSLKIKLKVKNELPGKPASIEKKEGEKALPATTGSNKQTNNNDTKKRKENKVHAQSKTASGNGNTAKKKETKYVAVITQRVEKSTGKTIGWDCHLEGFENEIKVIQVAKYEDLKKEFKKAMDAYIKKVRENNDKAKAKGGKGTVMTMIPSGLEFNNIDFMKLEKAV